MAMKRSELEELGKTQLYILRKRRCPEQIIEMLKEKLPAVVEKALTMMIPDNHLAILPIIKPAYLGYYGLVSLVRNGTKKGYTYINPSLITDKVETPNNLYYMYDVEDGGALCGKSPEDAEKLLKAERRSPLTAAEAIALATYTNVLSRHFVDASGSRCGSGGVPVLCLCDGGPLLDWHSLGRSYSRWGAASCGSR